MSAEPSATPKSIEERVAEALASGLWKERTAPNGKKYFVHVKTKKSVWNLAKELAQEAATSSSATTAEAPSPSSKGVREERLEKARRRQEEESHLNSQIAALERQKIKLEGEIALLQGPVEAEAAAIEELKKNLMDQKQSVDLVAREVTQRRKERMQELSVMEARVAKLEAAKESDVAHRETMRRRHQQLLAETEDLRSDLLREGAATEALRESARAAELRLDQVKLELNGFQAAAEQKRELMAKLEADVVNASKEKALVEERVAALKKELAELQQRVDKRLQMSNAQKNLEMKQSGADAENEMLHNLMERVEQKKLTLKRLKARIALQHNVENLGDAAAVLKHLLQDAKRDKQEVERVHAILESQVVHSSELLADYKARAAELESDTQAFIHWDRGV